MDWFRRTFWKLRSDLQKTSIVGLFVSSSLYAYTLFRPINVAFASQSAISGGLAPVYVSLGVVAIILIILFIILFVVGRKRRK